MSAEYNEGQRNQPPENPRPSTSNQPHIELPESGENPSRYRKMLRYLSEHASRISSASFIAGNVIFTAKAGIHPDRDTAAGISFDATSIAFAFADKYPTATYRVVGGLGLIGTGFLISNGIDFDTGQIVDWWRVASPAVGFGTAFTLIGLQKEIAQAAEKAKASKDRIKRAFAATQRYPVALGAAIETVGSIGLGISAWKNKDWKTLSAVGTYIVGAAALGLSDPRARELLSNYVGSSPESFTLQQAREEQTGVQEQTIFDSKQLKGIEAPNPTRDDSSTPNTPQQ